MYTPEVYTPVLCFFEIKNVLAQENLLMLFEDLKPEVKCSLSFWSSHKHTADEQLS